MSASSFNTLVGIMVRLRSESGCPWDREQTHESLKPYLLEETYEVLECIDADNKEELCKELGDLLLQVVFHAQIGHEQGEFNIDQVCEEIVAKLVRRHPHVFSDTSVENADQVVVNWERIKMEERNDQASPVSALDGVPTQLPALLRAQRLQSKASRVGFDWEDIEGPLEKVAEELAELRGARHDGGEKQVQEEFGDLLFALVNVGRFLDLCPEDTLRRAAEKFERRFRQVEILLHEKNKEMQDLDLTELDRFWDQVKGQD